jgi:hypothetical protein
LLPLERCKATKVFETSTNIVNMANKKVPGRDDFDAQLGALEAVGIPHDYATIIHHTRRDLPKRLIHDVRHGKRVNFDVLGEIRRVVRERTAANLLHTQVVQHEAA